MASTRPTEPSRIEPIRCEKCGGRATLMRRTPDAFKRDGKSELRTFECEACGHQMTVATEA